MGDEHREEQYMTNPQDKILLDYNASLLDHSAFSDDNTSTAYPHNASSSLKNPKIATYELSYGKGKVISLGIYSDDLINNYRFNKFLDSLLFKYLLKTNKD